MISRVFLYSINMQAIPRPFRFFSIPSIAKELVGKKNAVGGGHTEQKGENDLLRVCKMDDCAQ